MTVPSNHDVIVQHDAKLLHCFLHFAGDLDITFRQCWIARRMAVYQDYGRGSQYQPAFDDFSGIKQCVVDRAALLNLIRD